MLYNYEKYKECKYPAACKYGIIGVYFSLLTASVYIIPKAFKYLKNKLERNTKSSDSL
jgi:hypothetical protein